MFVITLQTISTPPLQPCIPCLWYHVLLVFSSSWFPVEDSHTLLWSFRFLAFDYSFHTHFVLPVLFSLILQWIISIYSLDLWDFLTYFAFSQQLSISSLQWLLSLCRLASSCFTLKLSVLRQLIWKSICCGCMWAPHLLSRPPGYCQTGEIQSELFSLFFPS